MTDRNILAVDFGKTGTLYVAAYPAKLSIDGPYDGRKTSATPRLAICSDPDLKWWYSMSAAPDGSKLTIRGRKYVVHTGRTWSTDARDWRADLDLSNYKPFLNDKDVSVPWDTATHRELAALVDQAAGRYVEQHRDWEQQSIRLAVERLHDQAQRTVEEAQKALTAALTKRDSIEDILLHKVIKASHIGMDLVDRR